MRAGRRGDLVVCTSLLTLTECLHVNQEYSDEVQHTFKVLLSGASGVIPIQPDIFIIERARDLRWVHNIALKPLDSIHVASAIEFGCAEFVTTDEPVLKRVNGINGAHQNIQAILASCTDLLPDEYRQAKMSLGAPASGAPITGPAAPDKDE